MSELIKGRNNRRGARWQLLTTVSAIALIATNGASASEDGRPTVWIELGGQLEKIGSEQDTFAPPFILADPRPPAETVSPLNFERGPNYSKGAEGSISISPSDSDWKFSASVRYGRSNNQKRVHQQSNPGPFIKYALNVVTYFPLAAKFSDVAAKNSEQHLVLDFQVGKDVGLGMFEKHDISSTVNLGVRFAQFNSSSDITLRSDPDWHFGTKYINLPPLFKGTALYYGQPYHSFAGFLTAHRSFHGIGPSLSWNGSMPMLGSPESSEVSLDWGVNAAALFGRQKAQTHHQTTARYHHPRAAGAPLQTKPGLTIVYASPATPDHTRSRSVIVPNVGGFAGLSVRYSNAKISFGYRADFFLNAMDGGIDTRKSENIGFHGPFASISLGLGG